AIQGAADLARNAERAAVDFGDINRLDLRRQRLPAPTRHPQQPFARAVDRDLLGDDLRPRQRVSRIEPRPQVLRYVGHLIEGRGTVDVGPAPELGNPHPQMLSWHLMRGQRLAKLRPPQADVRRPGILLYRG